MRFTINGQSFELESADVEKALTQAEPEQVQTHGVKINGKVFPPKQALAAVTNLDRLDFTSATARRVLGKLGFELMRTMP